MLGNRLIKKKSRRHLSGERKVSPLTLKIWSINIIAIFVVLIAVLHLDRYEDSLIQSELEALEHQAELFANALSEVAVKNDPGIHSYLSSIAVQNVINRSALRSPARSRVFDTAGRLLADSQELPGRVPSVITKPLASVFPDIFFQKFFNDFFQQFFNSSIQVRRPINEAHKIQLAHTFPEVISALKGSSIKTVKLKETGESLLTVAVPIQKYKRVLGVLLLSVKDEKVDAAFSSYQKELIIAVVIALVITSALSLYLSRSITKPILSLASAAEKIKNDRSGRSEIPEVSKRDDELGDLSRALIEMTNNLWQRLDAIEKFAADVSHEIKNPLTSIKSAIETATKIKDSGKRDQLLTVILDDVNRLDRLITDISDSSRLDAELSREKFEAIDIESLLLAFHQLRKFQKRFEQKSLTLNIEKGEKQLLILGHESRIVQVIDNIVNNAITFAPVNSNINISVSADTTDVKITIDDEGPGIPENKLDAIFERFYSERPAAEKFGLHSGLGLSICKQIVEAHNGKIFAKNRTGYQNDITGARFIITLPIMNKGEV
tara:strand:- start:928 stop:2577 length:1650 start_codon:yes stop_codon:yes gene_type:complete